jgi:hypothetical protein
VLIQDGYVSCADGSEHSQMLSALIILICAAVV